MASEKVATSGKKTTKKGLNRHSFVVLFPLFIAGTFSFGYLTFQSANFSNDTPPTIGSSSPQKDASSEVQEIDSAISKEAPLLAPIEVPSSQPENVSDGVVPGGNVADANKQTGATNALQGAPQAPIHSESNTNKQLQAPSNTLRSQLESLLSL